MKLKLSAALLALLMCMSLLVISSCGGGGGSSSPDGAGDTAADTASAETAAETTTDIYANLPTGDLVGREMRIINQLYTWAITQIDSEGIDGEIINDEIFNRNRKLEDKLNFTFKVTDDSGDVKAKVKTSVQAGDGAYDLMFTGAFRVAPSINEGLFTDLNTIDTINLDNVWWDQTTRGQYTLNNKLYWMHGSMQLMIYEGLWTMMFNKQIVEDFALDNLYDLVVDGKWTYERMTEMMKAVSEDLNGNGSHDFGDRFGIVTHTGSVFPFLHGLGEGVVKLGADGVPALAETDEKFVGITDALKSFYSDKEICGLEPVIKAGGGDMYSYFSNDLTLFLVEVMGRVRDIRQMDSDFGLVPYPKYDEAQEFHIGYISPDTSALFWPVTNTGYEDTGIFLENFGASSYETVRPAYYDVTLQGKRLRDNESEKMLDYIYGHIQCEYGFMFRWAGIDGTFKSMIADNKETVSTFDSVRSAVEGAIAKTMEYYES